MLQLYLLRNIVPRHREKDRVLEAEWTLRDKAVLLRMCLFLDHGCLLPDLVNHLGVLRCGQLLPKIESCAEAKFVILLFRRRRILTSGILVIRVAVREGAGIRKETALQAIFRVIFVVLCTVVGSRVNLTDNVSLQTCEVLSLFPGISLGVLAPDDLGPVDFEEFGIWRQ